MLSPDHRRCIGIPAGPTGLKTHPYCQGCQRRAAPRFPQSKFVADLPMAPPCPHRIEEVSCEDHS